MLLGIVARLAIITCLFISLLAWIAPLIGRVSSAPIVAYIGRDASLDWYHLYILDIWRGTTIRLTYFNNFNGQPAWSPDGNYLLFTAGGDYNPITGRISAKRIFQMNFFTHTQRLLTDNRRGVNEEDPSWSQDGRIAYAVYRSGDWDIAITRPNRYQTQLVSNMRQPMNTSAHEHTPRWSPDGSQIAYLVGGQFFSELAVADATGNNARMLTNGMQIVRDEYDWSPDGAYIVFTTQRDGNYEIYRVNVSNGAIINLSRHPSEDFSPKWSPNGDKIAFISSRNGGLHLFLMTVDGVDIQQLTSDNNRPATLIWSPDADWLVYTAAHNSWSSRQLYIVATRGGEPRQLTFSYRDHFSPKWKPR